MSQPTSAPANAGPKILKLKKGDLLFAEGDLSKAMYLLKTGSIRVFKKKATSFIEIDTIRSGQIIGELAFLDGLPRSASCEAIQDCELIEISGATFTDTMTRIPEWLKSMLKTIVGRLRASSNKIRQLESASQGLDYQKDGKSQAYVYLSQIESSRIAATLLLIASRFSPPGSQTGMISAEHLTQYGLSIFNIATSKLTSFLDLLCQSGIAVTGEAKDGQCYEIMDLDFLEKYAEFVQTESATSTANRRDLTLRGFFVMSYILKHLHGYRKGDEDLVTVDIAEIQRREGEIQGKLPFKIDEAEELIRVGFIGLLQYPSDNQRLSSFSYSEFMMHYKIQRTLKALDALNEQKRKASK